MAQNGIGSDVRMVLQLVLYCMTFLLGFVVIVPIVMTTENFDGDCIMYPKSARHGDDNVVYVTFGPKRNCNFVVGTHGVFSITFSFIMIALLAYGLFVQCRQKTEGFASNFIFYVITVGSSAFATFLCFVAACIVTLGFKSFCSTLKEQYPTVDDCSKLQHLHWKHGRDGSSFYKDFSLSLVVAWIATVIWFLQTVISSVTLWMDIKSGRSLGRAPPGATNLQNEPTTDAPTTVTGVPT